MSATPLVILNGTVAAQNDVQAAKTVDLGVQRALERARKVILQIRAANKVGAPDFTLTGLSISYDGTNYRQAASLSLAVTANGELAAPEITLPLIGVAKVKLDCTVANLDVDNKIDLLATLIAVG